eukprot:ANDGO_00653.mRNA.1 hypothetical protein
MSVPLRISQLLPQIEAQVFDDSRPVNFKSLAYTYGVSALEAQQVLESFAAQFGDRCIVLWRIFGVRISGNNEEAIAVVVCDEKRRREIEESMARILSSSIYGIRAKASVDSLGFPTMANVELAVAAEYDDRSDFFASGNKIVSSIFGKTNDQVVYNADQRALLTTMYRNEHAAKKSEQPQLHGQRAAGHTTASASAATSTSASTSTNAFGASTKAQSNPFFKQPKPASTVAGASGASPTASGGKPTPKSTKSGPKGFFAKVAPRKTAVAAPKEKVKAELDQDDEEGDIDMFIPVEDEEAAEDDGDDSPASVHSDEEDVVMKEPEAKPTPASAAVKKEPKKEVQEEDIQAYARRVENEQRARDERQKKVEAKRLEAERNLGFASKTASSSSSSSSSTATSTTTSAPGYCETAPSAKRQRVLKKKTYVDEKGYLVSEEVWEEVDAEPSSASTSQNNSQPRVVLAAAPAVAPKPLPATGLAASSTAKKPQQKSISSFFGK